MVNIIETPIITEKMTKQGESLNRYGFKVKVSANKIEIAKAIEQLYNVTVVSVNTMRYSGKKKSRYTKSGVIAGKTKAVKKAVVTLAKGESIDFYSNI
jgi:large subunit ribosomal protein L23